MDTAGTYPSCKWDGVPMVRINSRWEGDNSDYWRYGDEFCGT
jgi:hypothetical protein